MQRLCFFLLFLSCSFSSAKVSIHAQLSEKHIPLGGSVRLDITVENSNKTPQLHLPEGLSSHLFGRSQQVSIINGSMTSSAHYTYRVVAQKEGNYQLNKITVDTSTAPPLSLLVKGIAPAPSSSSHATGQSPSPPQPANLQKNISLNLLLELDKQRKNLFVGESIPFELTLIIKQPTRLLDLTPPTIKSDAFTLDYLSTRPQQRERLIDHTPALLLTWKGTITAIQSGSHTLSSELRGLFLLPQSPDNAASSSALNDPLMQIFFQSAAQRKEATIHSSPRSLIVRSLPEAGKPDHFQGAIGQFTLSSAHIPQQGSTGQPLNARITVRGKGNFTRIVAPQLLPSTLWKSYNPQSQSRFDDAAHFQGEKTFTMPIKALRPTQHNEASFFSFAFFDPQSERYYSIQSPHEKAHITGVPLPPSPSLPHKPLTNQPPTSLPNPPKEPTFLEKPALHFYSANTWILSKNHWAWGSSCLALLFLTFMGGRWVKNHWESQNPQKVLLKKQRKEEKYWLIKAQHAAKQHHLDAFLNHARHYISLWLDHRHLDEEKASIQCVAFKEWLAFSNSYYFARPTEKPTLHMETFVELFEKARTSLNSLPSTSATPLSWGQIPPSVH